MRGHENQREQLLLSTAWKYRRYRVGRCACAWAWAACSRWGELLDGGYRCAARGVLLPPAGGRRGSRQARGWSTH
jgi:hypothetical protein